jgi:chemotaxis protein CheD
MTAEQSPRSTERIIHIHQGECRVSEDANVVLTTILGSCISACLRDPVACVGGMNHFLLPETNDSDRAASTRYGANSMELLVNGLLSLGAKRERLQAKLFGGGQLSDNLTDVGEKNASFAERYLKRESIPIIGGSVRGRQARRIQFWPVSGRVRQLTLAIPLNDVAPPRPEKTDSAVLGAVELF